MPANLTRDETAFNVCVFSAAYNALNDDADDDFSEELLEAMVDTWRAAAEAGYTPSEIATLARFNADTVANTLHAADRI